jgi:antitoxin VapB
VPSGLIEDENGMHARAHLRGDFVEMPLHGLRVAAVKFMPALMKVSVIPERRVKLFKNGRNQMVRIPREFELPGGEAVIRKEGDRLIIEPIQPKSLLEVLAALSPLDEAFPPIPALPIDSIEP